MRPSMLFFGRGPVDRGASGDGSLPPGRPPQVRRARYPADPGSVGDARRWVAEALADVPGAASIASLLVSELATNALRHGGGSFDVVVRLGEGTARVEVHDTSPAAPAVGHPSADAPGGRGLRIVDALADAWGVDADPPGKAVWFVLYPQPATGRLAN